MTTPNLTGDVDLARHTPHPATSCWATKPLPDESTAGQTPSAPLSAAELDAIAHAIRRNPCEGYPTLSNRLYLHSPGLRCERGRLIVPDGPWTVRAHPHRRAAASRLLDAEVPAAGRHAVEPARSAQWAAAGLTLDQHGRPVHPDWHQLLGDRRIGLPTGAGWFFGYGPNSTVDAVIYRCLGTSAVEILLIARGDGQGWALPGGFLDPTDRSPEDAARREAAEETGLETIGGHAEVLCRTRSIGPMATLHAWTENTLVLIHGDHDYLANTEPVAGDDAADVAWISLPAIAGLHLYDRHHEYVAVASHHITRSRIHHRPSR